MKNQITIHIKNFFDKIEFSGLPDSKNTQELEKTIMECLTRVVHNGSKIVDEPKVVTDIGNVSATPKENYGSSRPNIHLHIGTLIGKVSIDIHPSTEKTREDLRRLMTEANAGLEGQVLEAVMNALCTAQETYYKLSEVDNTHAS